MEDIYAKELELVFDTFTEEQAARFISNQVMPIIKMNNDREEICRYISIILSKRLERTKEHLT